MSQKKNVSYSTDVRGFIEFFGGAAAMRQRWEASGFELTKGAQDKWLMRESIPTARLLEAATVAGRMRKRIDLNQFVVQKKKVR